MKADSKVAAKNAFARCDVGHQLAHAPPLHSVRHRSFDEIPIGSAEERRAGACSSPRFATGLCEYGRRESLNVRMPPIPVSVRRRSSCPRSRAIRTRYRRVATAVREPWRLARDPHYARMIVAAKPGDIVELGGTKHVVEELGGRR